MINEILTEHAVGVNPMLQDWCSSAWSMVGTSPDGATVTILPIRCRRWRCPYCWIPNEILLKERVVAGEPNRMITLTVRPDHGETPKDTNQRCRPAVSRLYQQLRRQFDGFEACTFLELHRSGFPHWHALARCEYIPWEYLRNAWNALTGSFVVDIRKITDPKIATRYVAKYVTKQLRQTLALNVGMVVRFTRHYSLMDKTVPAQTKLYWRRDKRHPADVAEAFTSIGTVSWTGHVATVQITTQAQQTKSVW